MINELRRNNSILLVLHFVLINQVSFAPNTGKDHEKTERLNPGSLTTTTQGQARPPG